jgi:RNA polymerase sigma factor FliA
VTTVIRIEDYLSRARSLASRFPESAAADREDHAQEALIGLLQAAARYEPERGVAFNIFAARRMHGEITDSLRRIDPVPRRWRAERRRLEQAEASLAQELGREPTNPETAAAAGIDSDTLRRIRDATSGTGSLDVPYADQAEAGESGEVTAVERLVDERAEEGAEQLLAGEFASGVQALVGTLPAREEYVVRALYFGHWTGAEVAQSLGVTESRVAQIHTSALRRLRGDDRLEAVRALRRAA